jgi:hypothetical protein
MDDHLTEFFPESFFSGEEDQAGALLAPKLTELKNLLHTLNLQHAGLKVFFLFYK